MELNVILEMLDGFICSLISLNFQMYSIMYLLASHIVLRCIKLTDVGLQKILIKCIALQSLNLYALSRQVFECIMVLINLEQLHDCFCVRAFGISMLTAHHLGIFLLSCRFARKAYESIGCLAHLRFLDLCGAQVFRPLATVFHLHKFGLLILKRLILLPEPF